MSSSTVAEEIKTAAEQLPLEQQLRVLQYIHGLTRTDRSMIPTDRWLELANRLPAEEVERLQHLLDAEFGQVDPDAW